MKWIQTLLPKEQPHVTAATGINSYSVVEGIPTGSFKLIEMELGQFNPCG